MFRLLLFLVCVVAAFIMAAITGVHYYHDMMAGSPDTLQNALPHMAIVVIMIFIVLFVDPARQRRSI